MRHLVAHSLTRAHKRRQIKKKNQRQTHYDKFIMNLFFQHQPKSGFQPLISKRKQIHLGLF